MAKNPNRSPDKGFSKELASSPKLKPATAKKKFTWHKTVSGGEAKPDDMGTTRRLNQQREAAPADSNYSDEMGEMLRKRKAKL